MADKQQYLDITPFYRKAHLETLLDANFDAAVNYTDQVAAETLQQSQSYTDARLAGVPATGTIDAGTF